jgi:UDP-N-acetylglucosamine 4,6-dehydratase
MRITDLAKAVSPDSDLQEVGMRPGEKLHEEMISADDSRRTYLLKDRYVVTPVVAEWGYENPSGVLMEDGVAYQSNTNDLWMSTNDISDFLKNLR